MAPTNYVMNPIQYGKPAPSEPSVGILANSFGAPSSRMIPTEDLLMLRTTTLSKCGRVPTRVREDELRAADKKARDDAKDLPRGSSKETPVTQWLHRSRKACTPVSTITNQRIADRSILLLDPFTAVKNDQFFWIPGNTDLQMRDGFKQCDRKSYISGTNPMPVDDVREN